MWKKVSLFIVGIMGLSLFVLNQKVFTSVNNDKNKNIAIILPYQNDDYWKNVRMGANVAAKEFNVKIDISAPEELKEVNGQKNLLDEAINRRVDAIILASENNEELSDSIERAYELNIPIIEIDNNTNSNKVSSFIGTDNIDAGKKAGEKLIDIIGRGGNIAIINFSKVENNAKEREVGLKAELSKYEQIKLITIQYNLDDSVAAALIAKDIINKNSSLDAIVCLNSASSIGSAMTIDVMGIGGKIKLIAFDSSSDTLNFMDKGIINATILQSPFSMGYLGVKNAVLKIQGNKIPKYIDTGITVIDKNNMYSAGTQKSLFPFLQ